MGLYNGKNESVYFEVLNYIKENHPLRNTSILKLCKPQRFICGLQKSTSLVVLYIYVSLRIRLTSVLHKMLTVPFRPFCNVISL